MPARMDSPTPAALVKRVRRLAAAHKAQAHRTRDGRWFLIFEGGRSELIATTEAACAFLERRKRRS